ncbi:MAG: hypothetical protein R6X32_01840 [Chloroflexota bacterium]
MDRTVPTSGNEEINLYLQTYYSLLRSTREVQIKSLIEAHKHMNSALHVKANSPEPDLAAWIYSVLRLPTQFQKVSLVLMGQSAQVFAQHGYANVEQWQQVSAPGRRRRSYFDGERTMGVFIASRSDIDDLVPMITAYQIERSKLYHRLNKPVIIERLEQWAANRHQPEGESLLWLAQQLEIPSDDLERLCIIWGETTAERLLDIVRFKQEVAIRSLAGSLADYKRATRRWWRNVESRVPAISFEDRPVYFVSSNTHSLANLISGYALQIAPKLREFISAVGSENLKREHDDILEKNVPSSMENFLYYTLKKYETIDETTTAERLEAEQSFGIYRVPSKHSFDIEVQIIDLKQLATTTMDHRVVVDKMDWLAHSEALIVNVDYPLGMAAYQVLSEIARNINEVRGVYIMGKAATLNGRIGDVMIPSVVHDEHSLNTYLFHNCFTADHVARYLVYGSVLDNQKAITAPGTFLQNEGYMSIFYQEGYTDMEMEAGPYLSSTYEMTRPKRHPYNEVVSLYNASFPIGILHYASDTPFSKGKNLGTQNLSYFGMDPTYATTIAILRAIFEAESKRFNGHI